VGGGGGGGAATGGRGGRAAVERSGGKLTELSLEPGSTKIIEGGKPLRTRGQQLLFAGARRGGKKKCNRKWGVAHTIRFFGTQS